ncbi:alpha-hydroxy acid oxidase [Cognatishimia sp. F0-27]|uniref:alpha-hydroxy acid oxidase n=1 Tax=Cognatishimia sp. F0-27 TaxID=2816855 RepID=UPI001D0C78C6|nr:alpha-hydroxy acid oxidase [Cognatishimia sp. F0-27]MCC1492518.1 alpha-hydroxy-acid oxidizing protein [Cognatishimia sp. F0-27]
MSRMDLDARFPSLPHLRARARQRLPRFVWDYLDSGTGAETARHRIRAALDAVLFQPAILTGEPAPDLSTEVLGTRWSAPFGVAPVGMSGLIWPDAERLLASAAADAGIPYTLSTVAAATPEQVGPATQGKGWFQLYCPRDPAIRADMLARARDSGFSTLVLTADLPAASRRERLLASGLTQPPRLTPRLALQCALRPAWSLARLRHGMPSMKTLEAYADNATGGATAHIGYRLRVSPDWTYLEETRALWDGPLIVKGVLRAEDAPRLEAAGIDALWVSGHAGRQFDGAPAPLDSLRRIRAACTLPLIYDSGIEGGLDILRAIALGADLVMLGRGWHDALAALGAPGAAHLAKILRADLCANLAQLGANRPVDLRGTEILARASGP